MVRFPSKCFFDIFLFRLRRQNISISHSLQMDQDQRQKLEELKKQRDDLNKMIDELSASIPVETNIPYTLEFLKMSNITDGSVDLTKTNPSELVEIRIFVNKKCNQISTDFEHTLNLVNQILPRKGGIFNEIFARKVLDQGRVQVSGHLDSYKPFSFLLFKLNSPEIINIYLSLLIKKSGNESELRGMYAIYFGLLNLQENIQFSWIWLASVLNIAPNEQTGYILEVFLFILGDLLCEKLPNYMLKALRYIDKYFIKELNNKPVEIRISAMVNGFMNKFKK